MARVGNRLAAMAAALAAAVACAAAQNDTLLTAMEKELARSIGEFRKAPENPAYYLGYEVHETHRTSLSATLGAMRSQEQMRYRNLTVDVRVGSRAFDNTHQVKGAAGWQDRVQERSWPLVTDVDEEAVRTELWLATDQAFCAARERYTKLQTNKASTATEEDGSDDFSADKPGRCYEPAGVEQVDLAAWRGRLREASAELKRHAFVIESDVSLNVETVNRYIVDSDGARVVTGRRSVELNYSLRGRTADGMDLHRFRSYEASGPAGLPQREALAKDLAASARELEGLVKAPLAEPYVGPAIFRARASGVYFHEILGHRLEGHRQKREEEGQTFTAKVGQPITADFLSVYDDPTLARWTDGCVLNGHYRFDDEGIGARRVCLVDKGVLKGFLLSRSPIRGFAASTGHGRRAAGQPAVARMGVTVVQAARTVPYPALRRMLVDEVRRRGKPYGLVFEDVAGGFSITGRGSTQAFKVAPLLVYRVYADGRADELVRGADIVGTPLQSFTKILAAADDSDVFNGHCGAESGLLPVSAVAPSLLVGEIEVEKKHKESRRPPALPEPHHDAEGERP